MKRFYVSPEFETVIFENNDIITSSPAGSGDLATTSGDNNISVPPTWWD